MSLKHWQVGKHWLARLLVGLTLSSAAVALPVQAAGSLSDISIAGGAAFINSKLTLSGHSAIIAQQGWLEAELKKRGLGLKWFPVAHAATGPMINEGFTSRQIQFASYGDLPSLILNASGVSTRLVVPNGLGVAGDTYLVVPAKSAAKTIHDLKGKRLAIHKGRPWEVPLIRLLEKEGLSYDDFQTYNIDPQAGTVALATGGVDALYTSFNDAFMLEERKVGRILWSTAEMPEDWKMRTELWGAKWFLDDYPDLAQLVVTAYIKAADWASRPENRTEAIKLIVRPGTPDAIVKRTYSGDDDAWRRQWAPIFTPPLVQHYRVSERFAADRKLISARVDIDKLIDDRFARNALDDLGIAGRWADIAAAARP